MVLHFCEDMKTDVAQVTNGFNNNFERKDFFSMDEA